MVRKLNLGQLVDRYFDALPAKYERVMTSKPLTSGITMIAGGCSDKILLHQGRKTSDQQPRISRYVLGRFFKINFIK